MFILTVGIQHAAGVILVCVVNICMAFDGGGGACKFVKIKLWCWEGRPAMGVACLVLVVVRLFPVQANRSFFSFTDDSACFTTPF